MNELEQAHDLLAIVLERDFGYIPQAAGEARVSIDAADVEPQVTLSFTWKVEPEEC